MTEYSKYNVIYRLQRWLDSVPGQTFLNYAYSWGASIVILGTLFKLTHMPGANLMLYIGMGTEVIVFFISAFDRPFDKTAIGKDLPTHVTDSDVEDEDVPADEAFTEEHPVTAGAAVPPGMVAYVGPVAGQPASAEGQVAATGTAEEGVLPSGQPVVAGQAVPGWVAAQQQVSPEMEEACAAYALHLGNAFQIADDILDYMGEAATIGKNLGADLREGKVTLPLYYAMQLTTPEKRECIREAIRKGDGDFEQISRIVIESGALPKCLQRAQEEVELGKQKLSALPSGQFKESLIEFLALTVQRNK